MYSYKTNFSNHNLMDLNIIGMFLSSNHTAPYYIHFANGMNYSIERPRVSGIQAFKANILPQQSNESVPGASDSKDNGSIINTNTRGHQKNGLIIDKSDDDNGIDNSQTNTKRIFNNELTVEKISQEEKFLNKEKKSDQLGMYETVHTIASSFRDGPLHFECILNAPEGYEARQLLANIMDQKINSSNLQAVTHLEGKLMETHNSMYPNSKKGQDWIAYKANKLRNKASEIGGTVYDYVNDIETNPEDLQSIRDQIDNNPEIQTRLTNLVHKYENSKDSDNPFAKIKPKYKLKDIVKEVVIPKDEEKLKNLPKKMTKDLKKISEIAIKEEIESLRKKQIMQVVNIPSFVGDENFGMNGNSLFGMANSEEDGYDGEAEDNTLVSGTITMNSTNNKKATESIMSNVQRRLSESGNHRFSWFKQKSDNLNKNNSNGIQSLPWQPNQAYDSDGNEIGKTSGTNTEYDTDDSNAPNKAYDSDGNEIGKTSGTDTEYDTDDSNAPNTTSTVTL